MRHLMTGSALTLAIATIAATPATAGPRYTQIYFTKNHNVGRGNGQVPAECVGIVATDPVPSQIGDTIEWTVVKGNGGPHHDDDCDIKDFTQVTLDFGNDKVVTKATLPANASGKISGTVSNMVPNGTSTHKYVVKYKGLAAGPDPQLIVGCSDCGGGQRDSAGGGNSSAGGASGSGRGPQGPPPPGGRQSR